MSPDLFKRLALAPALSLLPHSMDTPNARAMVIAICLQESRLKHRRQIGGPARGYAQFELGGGVKGVLQHPASQRHVMAVLRELDYDMTPEASYTAIEHNDILACVYARLLLWTHPKPLPGPEDVEYAWNYYIACWRPGKPHRKTWDNCFAQGWEAI